MVTIIDGVIGGVLATIVMTMFMMTMGDDSPPPTAAFYAKYIGDEGPDAYMKEGMLMHMMYGLGAGVAFAAIGIVGAFLFTPVTLVNGVLNGLVYGFILFVGAAVFWMKIVLAIEPEPPQIASFLFFHLVYGAVLGGWVGLGLLG